jgi:hypothetical protein
MDGRTEIWDFFGGVYSEHVFSARSSCSPRNFVYGRTFILEFLFVFFFLGGGLLFSFWNSRRKMIKRSLRFGGVLECARALAL